MVRIDGSVPAGRGDCVACGFCLLVLDAAWSDVPSFERMIDTRATAATPPRAAT
jgi:hypothetical protein